MKQKESKVGSVQKLTTIRGKRGTGSDKVLKILETEILTLKLKPGQPLDETALSTRFGTSRSPIREALIRLTAEGLAVSSANRSTLVSPIDLDVFPKYVDALDLLQRVNTRLAAQQRTEADIVHIRTNMDAFEQAVECNDHLMMSGTNRDFHLAIAQAGKNPFLVSQYKTLLNSGRRMLHLHFDYLAQVREEELLTKEHERMLEAIIDQDQDRAEKLAHAHTRQFRDRFLKFMSQNFTAEFSIDP